MEVLGMAGSRHGPAMELSAGGLGSAVPSSFEAI
jgi:hypothetical protein